MDQTSATILRLRSQNKAMADFIKDRMAECYGCAYEHLTDGERGVWVMVRSDRGLDQGNTILDVLGLPRMMPGV